MGPPVTAADCRRCGACCGPPYIAKTYIDLTPLDVSRLTPAQRTRYVIGVRRPALATTHTADGVVCVALRGRVGIRVSCGLYARRPGACRRFEPGSRACLAMRADVGVEGRT
jgi:Fe-S-cluster containining protein